MPPSNLSGYFSRPTMCHATFFASTVSQISSPPVCNFPHPELATLLCGSPFSVSEDLPLPVRIRGAEFRKQNQPMPKKLRRPTGDSTPAERNLSKIRPPPYSNSSDLLNQACVNLEIYKRNPTYPIHTFKSKQSLSIYFNQFRISQIYLRRLSTSLTSPSPEILVNIVNLILQLTGILVTHSHSICCLHLIGRNPIVN